MEREILRKWLLFIIVAGVVLAADQISKRVVIETLLLGQSVQPVEALHPFFQITRSENRGAAFGLLPGAGNVFTVIAIIVVLAMIWLYPRTDPEAGLTRFAFGLVCGGALGNVLDRIEYGLVIDFIHYQIPGLISNVSNLADHAIVLGVILIFIDSWRSDRRAKQAEAAATSVESDDPQSA
jgi:signal peptidase II